MGVWTNLHFSLKRKFPFILKKLQWQNIHCFRNILLYLYIYQNKKYWDCIDKKNNSNLLTYTYRKIRAPLIKKMKNRIIISNHKFKFFDKNLEKNPKAQNKNLLSLSLLKKRNGKAFHRKNYSINITCGENINNIKYSQRMKRFNKITNKVISFRNIMIVQNILG